MIHRHPFPPLIGLPLKLVTLMGILIVWVGGPLAMAQVTVEYDTRDGNVGVLSTDPLSSFSVESASGVFTGDPAMGLGGPFDVDTDNKIFHAEFGTTFTELLLGKVAQTGLTEEFLNGDWSYAGSFGAGGTYNNAELVVLPMPPPPPPPPPPPLGSTEQDPFMPTSTDPATGAKQFEGLFIGGGVELEDLRGVWVDPPPTSGLLFEITDGSSGFLGVIPPSDPDGYDDADGLYEVSNGGGPVSVAAGTPHVFSDPTSSFLLAGIDPALPAGQADPFPVFLAFNNDSVSFTITPVPEPSTVLLLIIGLLGCVAYGSRRR